MKLIATILSFISFISLKAQTFDVDTLLYNGSPDKRINIVILGDGYTTAQMSNFISDAKKTSDYMFTTSPYQEYKNYFNVFIIKVPSTETGVNHPATATDVTEPAFPAATVNNYFGSTFDYFSIHRLVVPNKTSSVINVLANNFPTYDQVLIIANSTNYGGSGGSYATFTVNTSSLEIAMHEIGHSFSGLADEYWAGDTYARETYNMTKETNPSVVKWKGWLGLNGIGIYQHSGSAIALQYYKPHQSCKMQALGNAYCSVCKERIIERIHELTHPIEVYSPANSSTITSTSGSIPFSITLLKPTPNTLKSTWTLNNNLFASKTETLNLANSTLIAGTNKLTYSVIDTTTNSKDVIHQTAHLYSVLWTIEKKAATSTVNLKNEIKLQVSPNPTAGILQIEYALLNTANMRFTIFDQQGKVVKTMDKKSQTSGNHNEMIDLSNSANGLYYLQILIDNQVVMDKIQVLK